MKKVPLVVLLLCALISIGACYYVTIDQGSVPVVETDDSASL